MSENLKETSEKQEEQTEEPQEEFEATSATEAEDEDLRKALKKEQERANSYLDRLKYLQADFENFRRRTQKEIDEKVNYGNSSLICELLTVLDELEYAVEAAKNSKEKTAITEGVEMVLKKLHEVLRKQGLAEIEAVGEQFDPNIHEAALRVPTKDYKEGTVIEQIRKGFILKGKVIRPSLVKVAISPQNSSITSKGDKD